MNINIIITAVIAAGAIGLIASAVLAIASKLMYVEVDAKVEQLREALPGANCGACGYSGCDGYAAALGKNEAGIDLCPPGGEETYKNLGEILGISAGEGPAKKFAFVRCLGDKETSSGKMEYTGINTCFAEVQLFGGKNSCAFGCLGRGDCAKVCTYDAICVVNGIAHVNTKKCTGCALCVKACPTGIITMERQPQVAVLCSNKEKGAVVRKKCSKGCIACMKCVRECHAEAISINEFLAVVDNEKCDGCGHCADICISKCIVRI